MNHAPPGCRVVDGGPQQDPDSGVAAVLVQVIEDGTYAFFYPHTNGFGNWTKAREIAEALKDKRSHNTGTS